MWIFFGLEGGLTQPKKIPNNDQSFFTLGKIKGELSWDKTALWQNSAPFVSNSDLIMSNTLKMKLKEFAWLFSLNWTENLSITRLAVKFELRNQGKVHNYLLCTKLKPFMLGVGLHFSIFSILQCSQKCHLKENKRKSEQF